MWMCADGVACGVGGWQWCGSARECECEHTMYLMQSCDGGDEVSEVADGCVCEEFGMMCVWTAGLWKSKLSGLLPLYVSMYPRE